MDMTRRIIEAVARADLILCFVGRVAFVVALLSLALLLVALSVRGADPDLIDYDKPGTDITSEGPEGYTRAWFEWGDGD